MLRPSSILKNGYSSCALLLVMSTLILVNVNIAKWKEGKVIDWDVIGFYAYLPATFIHHDFKLNFIKDHQPLSEEEKIWPLQTPNGGLVIKPTMGMAILYAPFFFAAHIHAQFAGEKAHGFSPIYHMYINWSCLFYLFLGLLCLRAVLLPRFGDLITAVTLIAVVLATNALYYASTEAAMAHVYNFSLLSIFVYAVIRWYASKHWQMALLMGITFGLLVLIRPVNLSFLLIPVLYKLTNVRMVPGRIREWFHQPLHLITFAGSAFLILVPQLLYWKAVTGSYVFYSYFDERFYFLNPHILDGLFSFRNGWLVYTPIMTAALAGVFLLKELKTEFGMVLMVILPVYFWLVFSWWCWWYIGYGNRAMIDIYPLLAIPLAACFTAVSKLPKTQTILLRCVFVLLFGLNIFQTIQYRMGLIHFDGMTWKAYVESFGRLHYTDAYKQAIQRPDYELAKKGK